MGIGGSVGGGGGGLGSAFSGLLVPRPAATRERPAQLFRRVINPSGASVGGIGGSVRNRGGEGRRGGGRRGGGHSHGGGGGGVGGGGGGGAPAPSLGENPAYLAFLRATGAEEADAAASTQQRIDQLNRDLARQLPLVTEQGGRTRQQISGGYESRGLFRSGEHETRLGLQRADEARETSMLQGVTGDQVGQLQAELARRRADIARRRTEAGLQAAPDVFLGK